LPKRFIYLSLFINSGAGLIIKTLGSILHFLKKIKGGFKSSFLAADSLNLTINLRVRESACCWKTFSNIFLSFLCAGDLSSNRWLLLRNPFLSFIDLLLDNLECCGFNFVSNLLSDLLELLTCLTFTWSQAKKFLVETFESINFWVKCFREQLNITCGLLCLCLGCFSSFFWGF